MRTFLQTFKAVKKAMLKLSNNELVALNNAYYEYNKICGNDIQSIASENADGKTTLDLLNNIHSHFPAFNPTDKYFKYTDNGYESFNNPLEYINVDEIVTSLVTGDTNIRLLKNRYDGLNVKGIISALKD